MESDGEVDPTSPEDSSREDLFEQLRNWQQQQQQRLLEQQHQQRQILIEQQKKLLTMLNPSENSTVQDSAVPPVNPTYLDVASVEGPLQSVTPGQIQNVQNRNFSALKKQSFDEIPLKKPRAIKTFNQLLETSLTKNENLKEEQDEKPIKKFPFLKRGQGISRFGFDPKLSKKRPNAPRKQDSKPGKENKIPLGLVTAEENNKVTKKAEKPIHNEEDLLPASLIPSRSSTNLYKNELKTNSMEERVYCQKPEVEVISGDSYVAHLEERELRSNRDEEDLAVFELLERFATINASFSSTSSFIGQLLDKGVNQLPSPSKVISFLAKKKQVHVMPSDNPEENSDGRVSKSLKGNKHVRFAESLEVSDTSLFEGKPCRTTTVSDANISDNHREQTMGMHPSPFISNTCQPLRPISNENNLTVPDRHNGQVELNETPTSPIGFPDFKKLFGDPPTKPPFWLNEYRQSSQGHSANSLGSKEEAPSKCLTPSELDLEAHALPIEDPQTVYQSSLVRSRLVSLEREIAQYRRENDSLRRARKELEESKLKLEQEQEKFRRYAENEKRRMQLLYSEEQKRVRAEQLKELATSKGSEENVNKLKEEIQLLKEEHRVKESKWMANQTKLQDKVRFLELRNRDLVESMEKLRLEEQQLRRRLNASLRPGAMMKSSRPSSSNPESNVETALIEEKRNLTSSPVVPTPETTLSPKETPAPESSVKTVKSAETEKVLLNQSTPKHTTESSGVTTTILPDGTKLLLYPNGNRKEIWPDDRGTQVIYYNGDIKQKLADGSVVYIYADTGTKHTTKLDGTEILEFTSGQIETTYSDGRSQVRYPGGACKTKYLDGREEAQWPDGTKLWTDGKGHGVMTFPSGMREIYTPICKRREYPDGTVKTVYEDGRSETRYSNGRIRVKDRDGNVVTDTGEVQAVK